MEHIIRVVGYMPIPMARKLWVNREQFQMAFPTGMPEGCKLQLNIEGDKVVAFRQEDWFPVEEKYAEGNSVDQKHGSGVLNGVFANGDEMLMRVSILTPDVSLRTISIPCLPYERASPCGIPEGANLLFRFGNEGRITSFCEEEWFRVEQSEEEPVPVVEDDGGFFLG